MSVLRFITVDCDEPDCEESYDSGTTSVATARGWANDQGWRCNRAGDRCPRHNAEQYEKRKRL